MGNDFVATDAEISSPAELHLVNHTNNGDFDSWVTLTGDVSEDSFSVDVPDYGSFFIVCLFGLGMLCGLVFAYLSRWEMER